ncbi:beta-amyrin 11-oxidase-like [Senna tora]|uniref:Beta-amyrin 11-oxidase-like n=1 Tax=Senna tora TaxID=362788 RepID=A0A834VXT3_9FABA|nr:beta-amyrin 11-oxidase-like [Senna tora]
MKMELPWLWIIGTIVGSYIFVFGIVKNINQWFYVERVKHKLPYPLPPSHMGWPFLGDLLSIITIFKSPNPDSFITNFISSYYVVISLVACLDSSPLLLPANKCPSLFTQHLIFRLVTYTASTVQVLYSQKITHIHVELLLSYMH